MKSPLSYFLISGVIILSVFIGAFAWRNQHLKEVPKFTGKSFTAPISSKYLPINADLVLHWKINPNLLPEYIGKYQDKASKNITNKQVKLIRDSSLKLISIDFTKDIAKFTGGYGSFAIFGINKKDLGWLMVLEANQDINTDEQLESISDPDITVEKIIRERAQPTNPTMTIFFLPTLSLKVPQIGLAIIQARAEIPKIAPICCSLSPRSLPKGGIVRNTTD